MAAINSIFTNSGPQLGHFQLAALATLAGAEVAAMSGALMILTIVAVVVVRFQSVRDYQLN
jgi:hypothetical protein